jgi:hypothetical protein
MYLVERTPLDHSAVDRLYKISTTALRINPSSICIPPTTAIDRSPVCSHNTTRKMLLDLPSELINVITGHLAPRPKWPRVLGHCPFEACTCLPDEDLDRQLLLYNVPFSGPLDKTKSYATDTLRLATADPYIARCIANGGWQGVVEMSNSVDLDVVRRIPEEFRGVIRYVLSHSANHGQPSNPFGHFVERSTSGPFRRR